MLPDSSDFFGWNQARILPSRSAISMLSLSRTLSSHAAALERSAAGRRNRFLTISSICSRTIGFTNEPMTAKPRSFAIRLMLLAMRREHAVTMARTGFRSWRAS